MTKRNSLIRKYRNDISLERDEYGKPLKKIPAGIVSFINFIYRR
jgi:hypothetical protein